MTQDPIPFRGMTPDGLAVYGEDPAPGHPIPPPPPDLDLEPWEVADPLRALRHHGVRQQWAGQQMARCMAHRWVRFPYGHDQLPAYQDIQADAFRRMVALRAILEAKA